MKINHEFLITETTPAIKVSNKEIGDLIEELEDKAQVWIPKSDSIIYVTIDGVNEGKSTSFDLESYQKIKDDLECAIDSYIMEGRKLKTDGSYGRFTLKLENYSKDIDPSQKSKWAAQNRNRLHLYGIKCTIDYEGDFEGGEVMKDLHEALNEIYPDSEGLKFIKRSDLLKLGEENEDQDKKE